MLICGPLLILAVVSGAYPPPTPAPTCPPLKVGPIPAGGQTKSSRLTATEPVNGVYV